MTKTTNDQANAATQPTYAAFHITEAQQGKKARWIRIGSFFAHDDGQGGNLILDALPFGFDGHVVLRTPKAN